MHCGFTINKKVPKFGTFLFYINSGLISSLLLLHQLLDLLRS